MSRERDNKYGWVPWVLVLAGICFMPGQWPIGVVLIVIAAVWVTNSLRDDPD